ncbi:AN1-type zinc finger domain-containing protein [Halarchaeum salinum]|uniref:AN1-type domain-containing protein n=1 Tax=Halarchaeum salinum TaxID=489912 RepID=A0AAV3S9M0_9EURY
MGDCSAFGCDGDDGLAFSCNECDQRFCGEHRLPENHRCPALLTKTDDDRKHFETGLADKDPESSTTPKSALTLAEKQRRSVRQWREEDEKSDDPTLEAGDSLFGDESSSRPWHRTQSSDGEEDLSPHEKQLRAQERMQQEAEAGDSQTATRTWPVILFFFLGLIGVVILSALLLILSV